MISGHHSMYYRVVAVGRLGTTALGTEKMRKQVLLSAVCGARPGEIKPRTRFLLSRGIQLPAGLSCLLTRLSENLCQHPLHLSLPFIFSSWIPVGQISCLQPGFLGLLAPLCSKDLF